MARTIQSGLQVVLLVGGIQIDSRSQEEKKSVIERRRLTKGNGRDRHRYGEDSRLSRFERELWNEMYALLTKLTYSDCWFNGRV
jgi:hypothetical protein